MKNFEICFMASNGKSRRTFIDAKDAEHAVEQFRDGLNGHLKMVAVNEVKEEPSAASN